MSAQRDLLLLSIGQVSLHADLLSQQPILVSQVNQFFVCCHALALHVCAGCGKSLGDLSSYFQLISSAFLKLSPTVLICPGQSNNNNRKYQYNRKRPGNNIKRKITNKQHNSQNHPEDRKYTDQIFPSRNAAHNSSSFLIACSWNHSISATKDTVHHPARAQDMWREYGYKKNRKAKSRRHVRHARC